MSRVYLSPCHRRRVEPVTDIPLGEPAAVFCPSCGNAWVAGDRRLDWVETGYPRQECPVEWCDRDFAGHGSRHQGTIWQTIAPAPAWRGGGNMTMQALLVGHGHGEPAVGFTIVEGSPTLPQVSVICDWRAVDQLTYSLEQAREKWGRSPTTPTSTSI